MSNCELRKITLLKLVLVERQCINSLPHL